MALLHALTQAPGLQLTVAHFDHGIREDSAEDRKLVERIARQYRLPFVYHAGNLGSRVSEAKARKARYDFLHKVREASGARAVITAHHKDDALETAIINLIRGTGRKGMSSLKSTDVVKRPLLEHTKADLVDYAKTHNLQWREDSTNASTAYLRNHIRHKVLTRLRPEDRQKLHGIIARMEVLNAAMDEVLTEFLERNAHGNRLRRYDFIQLPHNVALEVMAGWLRANNIRHFDKNMLERLTHAAKIHKVGREVPISSFVSLKIGREFLALESHER